MPACRAYGCKNRGERKLPGVTFHRFPKEEEKRNAWVKNMKIEHWTPSKNDRLCSVHFETRFFYLTDSKKVKLLNQAVPTIFQKVPDYMQPKKRTKGHRTDDTELVSSSLSIQTDPVFPTKKKLCRKLFEETIKSREKTRSIRVLRQSLKRCRRRVNTLKQIIKVLTEEKDLQHAENLSILENQLSCNKELG